MRSIWFIEQSIGDWLVRDYRRRTFRNAKIRACAAFVQAHPKWHEYLFDEHFLENGAAGILDGYLAGRVPAPVELALAWADQWGWQAQTRARLVAELTPVSAAFLTLFEVELYSAWRMAPTVAPISSSSMPIAQ